MWIKGVSMKLSRMTGTVVDQVLFFYRNGVRSNSINAIEPVVRNNIHYRGMGVADLYQVGNIYSQLNQGSSLSWERKKFYHLLGNKLMLLAWGSNGNRDVVVGLNMYYLNARDVKESTIHEGFIGVLPEARGQGIATSLRRVAKEHFAMAGFKGISTRISLCNKGSLNSALQIGFKPVEKYYDMNSDAERYYLVCNLEGAVN